MAKQANPAVGLPRINLMPRSEIEKRERERLSRGWVWAVLGAIFFTVLIILGVVWLNVLASQRLASEQSRTNDLLLQIASLSDVSSALATEEELTDFRQEAMATDVVWQPVLAAVVSVLPEPSVMTGFDFTVGGVPEGSDPATEVGLIGTVSVESPRPLDIVDIARSLREVEGVFYADGRSVLSSSSTSGQYAYILNVSFDQSVYSGAYQTVEEGDE